LKRCWILTVLLALLPLSGCRKSEGTKIQNFFGAPPTVSEVSITKERRDFNCDSLVDLCFPLCFRWQANSERVSVDLVTASAKVVDATPPGSSGPTDILVVVLRFLDPPPTVVPGGTTINQFSLEMFDNGPKALPNNASPSAVTYSGDLLEGDGTFTRKFYFSSTTSPGPGTCIEDTDNASLSHVYSNYTTSWTILPSAAWDYQFTVQAIDRSGNIDTSTEILLPIQGTFCEQEVTVTNQCCRADFCGPNVPAGCVP